MSENVQQWLTEIQRLRRQMEQVAQERDQAYGSAANWRSLYETEAQQRRTDAKLSQQKIESLQLELERLRSPNSAETTGSQTLTSLQEEVGALSLPELQQRLIRTVIECDRLSRALKQEKEQHTQTRNDLTAAISDAVESYRHVQAASTDKGKKGAATSSANPSQKQTEKQVGKKPSVASQSSPSQASSAQGSSSQPSQADRSNRSGQTPLPELPPLE